MEKDRLREIVREQLGSTLDTTNLPELGEKYEGKVRDCYIKGDRRVIVVTDRLSAFDRVITTIPFKGQVLNQLTQYWFEVSREISPNHMEKVPDPNAMVVRECTPLKAEFIMRSYLTGVTDTSIWRAYERGDRVFCGHALPDGMQVHQRLPAPILTPSTKADKGEHDISVSREQLLEMGVITEQNFDRAAAIATRLFAFGQEKAAERGLILVDTKYEIGIDNGGNIVVIDEIHTPDSSRYWYRESYKERMAAGERPRSLDKEYVRRWLADNHNYRGDGPVPEVPDDVRVEAAMRYIEIYELITGRPFVPDTSEPARRLASNLGAL